MSKKAVISMSGGLDSTSLALHLLSQGYEIRAYAFNYGQKHEVELRKVQKNVNYLRKKNLPITLQIIDLRSAFAGNTSALVASTGKAIPEGDYREESMKDTVVPLRNVIFSSIVYSKAINWAVQSNDKVFVTLGIHAGDHTIYPDCRPESQEACKHAFEISDWNSDKVDYEAPFVEFTKDQVLEKGIWACTKLGLDWRLVYRGTISCYNPDEKGRSCGKCGTCVERLEAFDKLGLEDPARYQY